MPKTEVELPEGMSPADFNKLFGTWQKQRISGKARDKAVRSAIKDLIEAHKPQYDTLVDKYMPK